MSRAERFVAENIGHGFTSPYGLPPRVGGHLTHCFLNRHIGIHSYSFGPSLAESSLPGATSNYYDFC